MRAVDDVRTLNKSLHFRPSCNCLSINELASLWENKIGRTLPRMTVTEDDLLAAAGGAFYHLPYSFYFTNLPFILTHSL